MLICLLPLMRFKHTKTEPDNWPKPTKSRSEGAIWQVVDRHVCYQEDREKKSVPGQRSCDRGAAAPLWPDTSDRWLTAGHPCLSVSSQGRAWQELGTTAYHLLVVCINPCLIYHLWRDTRFPWTPSPPLQNLQQVNSNNTNQDWQFCIHVTISPHKIIYNECIHVKNRSFYKVKLYLHGFVHDLSFKNKWEAMEEDPESC